MKLTYDLSLDDFVEFQRYHLKHSKLCRKNRTRLIFIFPMVLAIYFIFSSLQSGIDYVALGIFVVMSALWIIFMPGLIDAKAVKNMKKIYTESGAANIFGRHEIEIGDEFLAVAAPNGETKYRWAAVHELAETDRYFFIYLNSMCGVIVPRYKLEPAAETAAFAEALKKKTTKNG